MREIQPAKKSSQKQESEVFPQYECTRKADYFYGVSRFFFTKNEEQYQTIGAFWDEMSAKYGLENLQGLGYMWTGDTMSYAIGLKDGMIEDYDVEIWLQADGRKTVKGRRLLRFSGISHSHKSLKGVLRLWKNL